MKRSVLLMVAAGMLLFSPLSAQTQSSLPAFGDADGSRSIGGPDYDLMASLLMGASPSYNAVYPYTWEVQDLDGSGSAGGPDLDLYAALLMGTQVGILPGAPDTLTVTSPASGSVAYVGSTVTIEARVLKGSLGRAGIPAVFRVVSGPATLSGGRGTAPEYGPSARYDVSQSAANNGRARISAKINGTGPVVIEVLVPENALAHTPALTTAPLVLNGSPCPDNDGDGYSPVVGCGYYWDCNDNNASIHPGAGDVCGDYLDRDCDGFDGCHYCFCTLEYHPVCAWGPWGPETYGNLCEAQRECAQVLSEGECEGGGGPPIGIY